MWHLERPGLMSQICRSHEINPGARSPTLDAGLALSRCSSSDVRTHGEISRAIFFVSATTSKSTPVEGSSSSQYVLSPVVRCVRHRGSSAALVA